MSQKLPFHKYVLTYLALVTLAFLCLYVAFSVDIPWLRAVLVLVGAVMVWWLVMIHVRQGQIPGEFWCYFLYLFGAVACVFAFFPPPELAQLEQRNGKDWTPLYFGLAFILIGGFLHLVLIYLGRAGKENVKKWALILCGIVLLSIAYAYLRNKGYDISFLRFFFYLSIAVVVLLGVVFIVLASIYKRRMPVNQMARLIGKKRYQEVVELAESLPADARRPEVLYNLAVAYKLLGQNDKAQQLFEQLQTRSDIPEVIAEAIKLRLAELTSSERLS